jgi:hypothetical protein
MYNIKESVKNHINFFPKPNVDNIYYFITKSTHFVVTLEMGRVSINTTI